MDTINDKVTKTFDLYKVAEDKQHEFGKAAAAFHTAYETLTQAEKEDVDEHIGVLFARRLLDDYNREVEKIKLNKTKDN